MWIWAKKTSGGVYKDNFDLDVKNKIEAKETCARSRFFCDCSFIICI